MQDPKHWLCHMSRLRRVMEVKRLGIISDFDGTLSPITQHYAEAAITEENAQLLDALERYVALIAIVSGRAVNDLRSRIERPWITYYGSHGMEYWDHSLGQVVSAAPEWTELMQALLAEFGVPPDHVQVQNKGYTASIHYRQAEDPDMMRLYLLERLESLVLRYGFELSEGRRVWEIKPPVRLSKGTAVKKLVTDHQLDGVIFMGDDVTDLSAMQYLHSLDSNQVRSVCVSIIHLREAPGLYAAADLTAYGTDDVARLLNWIVGEFKQEHSILPDEY